MIYSFQSPESIGHDIETLGLAAVIADREDWTAPVIEAAKRAGSAGLAISMVAPPSGLSRDWSDAMKPIAMPRPNPVWRSRS